MEASGRSEPRTVPVSVAAAFTACVVIGLLVAAGVILSLATWYWGVVAVFAVAYSVATVFAVAVRRRHS